MSPSAKSLAEKSLEPSTVFIQGQKACFHEEAAIKFFGKGVELNYCSTFKELVDGASHTTGSAGVMAIENSIAGSILPNYNLLQQAKLHIIGEVYLHIRQHLMAYPGIELEKIREVHSHPMALQQCLPFLHQHGWRLVETEDTALSAKLVMQNKSKQVAAIAGELAAITYGLNVLQRNIHTLKNNYTRFLVLSKHGVEIEDADKASVQFTLSHDRGSLARVLSSVADTGINLSKLQSMPIPGSDFKYAFHADMEFEQRAELKQALEQVHSLADTVKILGIYKRGNRK